MGWNSYFLSQGIPRGPSTSMGLSFLLIQYVHVQQRKETSATGRAFLTGCRCARRLAPCDAISEVAHTVGNRAMIVVRLATGHCTGWIHQLRAVIISGRTASEGRLLSTPLAQVSPKRRNTKTDLPRTNNEKKTPPSPPPAHGQCCATSSQALPVVLHQPPSVLVDEFFTMADAAFTKVRQISVSSGL